MLKKSLELLVYYTRNLPKFSLHGMFLFIPFVIVTGLGTMSVVNNVILKPVPFEVSAFDKLGHPIAGAKIFIDEEEVGTTGAFGNWRGVVSVYNSEDLLLAVKKSGRKTMIGKSFIKAQEIREESLIERKLHLF